MKKPGITCQSRNSSFDELLKLGKLVSIHYRNLQYLLTEIYKVKMGLPPPIMNDILTVDQNVSNSLRSGVAVTRRNIRTNKFGLEKVQLEQFCGETYQTILKIQLV